MLDQKLVFEHRKWEVRQYWVNIQRETTVVGYFGLLGLCGIEELDYQFKLARDCDIQQLKQ